MVDLPGATFRMGAVDFYPEEGPVHPATVAGFAIERYPVTNAQFGQFVAETGYVTVAEKPLDPAMFLGADPAIRNPGAMVFRPTPGPVDLQNWRSWWVWMPGACWRYPFGPDGSDSTAANRADHPVVQVAYTDALAYARWSGRRLPTEAEWEYAARAGSEATYSWGTEVQPEGTLMANTWQGRFPYLNTGALGWVGTSPVGTFAPNGFGLFDMIGNVWEWTSTEFSARHRPERSTKTCCTPPSPPRLADPALSQVLKGGSHLCAPEYCHRYRPAARSPQSQDTATTHIGFRCVRDVP